MLIILVIIQVTRELFHVRVDPEGSRVRLLDPKVVGLKLTLHISLLLAVLVSDPDALDIRSTDDVVPVGVGATGVLLRQREDRVVVEVIGESIRDLLPQTTGLIGQRLELLSEVLKRFVYLRQAFLKGFLEVASEVLEVLEAAKDLLGRGGRGGRADQQRSW